MHNTVLHLIYGDIAQLGEHRVRNAGVTGSNPAISTMNTEPEAKAPGFFGCGASSVIRAHGVSLGPLPG
jgi:hypothetical protein